ncbi:MAG: Flp pilus assembly protein CpaB [Actinobacteria bacterium]|nr:Flp pilus assembly protein CpaB [Actinomycetota bacterium]
MRSRGLVVALALLLAIGATAAVFLYVNGVKDNAINSGEITEVVVATQPIPANTQLNPLIDQGVFVMTKIPTSAVVQDAVTNITDLRDRTAIAPILTNEQIPTERLSGGQQPTGGILGICAQCVALTVRVDGPPGVGGAIQRGDNVTLYASFDGVKGFSSVRDLINQINGKGPASQQTQQTGTAQFPPFTMTLEPTIKVLKVENPTVSSSTSDTTSQGSVTVTLDVPKSDAEFVVFAAQKGQLYFGLLPPDQQGIQVPAQSISLDRLLGKNQS